MMKNVEEHVDVEGDGQGYSGTFRWKKSKKLPSIRVSVPVQISRKLTATDLGWMPYFISRAPAEKEARDLITSAQNDLSIIDCLSSAVTIAYAFSKIGITTKLEGGAQHGSDSDRGRWCSRLSIICIGASAKAEERILLETSCWEELVPFFPTVDLVDLWLVGPEISQTEQDVKIKSYGKDTTVNNITGTNLTTTPEQAGRHAASSSFRCSLFQGTATQFFRSFPEYLLTSSSTATVVVGLNCGFGNFENPLPKRFDLLFSWLPDLYFLTATKLPLIFTCANDYADLAGECTVMQKVLGAYFLAPPSENPFSYASTFVATPPSAPSSSSSPSSAFSSSSSSKGKPSAAASPKTAPESEGYSRGNAFWYAVQGHDRARRVKIDVNASDRTSQFIRCLSQNQQRNSSTATAPATGDTAATGSASSATTTSTTAGGLKGGKQQQETPSSAADTGGGGLMKFLVPLQFFGEAIRPTTLLPPASAASSSSSSSSDSMTAAGTMARKYCVSGGETAATAEAEAEVDERITEEVQEVVQQTHIVSISSSTVAAGGVGVLQQGEIKQKDKEVYDSIEDIDSRGMTTASAKCKGSDKVDAARDEAVDLSVTATATMVSDFHEDEEQKKKKEENTPTHRTQAQSCTIEIVLSITVASKSKGDDDDDDIDRGSICVDDSSLSLYVSPTGDKLLLTLKTQETIAISKKSILNDDNSNSSSSSFVTAASQQSEQLAEREEEEKIRTKKNTNHKGSWQISISLPEECRGRILVVPTQTGGGNNITQHAAAATITSVRKESKNRSGKTDVTLTVVLVLSASS